MYLIAEHIHVCDVNTYIIPIDLKTKQAYSYIPLINSSVAPTLGIVTTN